MAGLELITHTPDVTERLGCALAGLLPDGVVVALFGDLATGKTCLVRGMAAHYADGAPVHSPTFTLVNQYGTDPALYHLDLYRLDHIEEIADLGLDEYFRADAVCAIEWAEKGSGVLPQDNLTIKLEHLPGDVREITPRRWPYRGRIGALK